MSTQFQDLVEAYLNRIRYDIKSVADNIQTDYQYDIRHK